MTELDALEKTFSSSPIPTIIIQVDSPIFKIVIANDAYLHAENIDTSEIIIGKNFLDTHQHVAEIDGYLEIFQSVLFTRSAHQGQLASKALTTYPLFSDDGEVTFLVQQLTVSPEGSLPLQKKFSANRPDLDLFEFSPVPMWVYDTVSLGILAANKAALVDYGYSLSEFLNTTVRILWPADETPRMEQMIATKVKKDLPNIATVRHIKRSGEIISVNMHSTPLPSWGKNARIVAAIDVTQNLRDEQTIKINRDRLRSLLQTTNGIVWEADPETHRFSYVSQYVEKVLGYSVSQWLGDVNFWKNHICPEDREMVLEARRLDLETGRTYSSEYRMVNAKGNVVWIRDTYTPIIQDNIVSLRGLMIDISIVKRSIAIDQLDKEILTNSAKEDNSFQTVLKSYLTGIEEQFPEIVLAIMSISDGKLSDLASPSLPKSILSAFEGLSYNIGKYSGDTSETDAAWENLREIISLNGFTSMLQYPIRNNEGDAVAVFLVYHNRMEALHPDEVNIIERTLALLRVIVQRRQYSKVLKETTLMMLQSQELARFGNWSWDIKSDIVTWSDTLYSIYGISPESFQATFEAYLNLVHPEDRQNSFNTIQDLLATGKDKSFEERMVRPGGEIRHMKTWAKVIFGESGQAEKMIGACLDITESKQTEDELQASKAELQKMLDRYVYVNKATNNAIYDWDIDTDLIDWGESFSRIFGYRKFPDNYTLHQWFKLVHPDDLETMTINMMKALENKDLHLWSAEYRIMKETGEYVFVDESGYILRDANGKARRMIGVVNDITESKKSERDLQLSNEKYAELFHLSPLPLLVYDLETLQILDVNKAAIEHYGYSSDEFLSFTLRDIRPPQDVEILDDLINKHVKAGHVHNSYSRHVKKSGKVILVNTKGNWITYKGRNARIVVAIDNSERIRAEESLKQSERRFRTMIQEGSDLIAILDHTGKISYISPNIWRLFNLDPRDITLTTPFDYIHEDDQFTIKNHLLNIRKNETVKISPYRVKLKGGATRWLETIITNKSHDPAVGGIIANSRDVTARMKALLKNKELLDRHNAVAKATSDTIWDSNLLTGRIIWNYALAKIFGHDKTQTSIDWWRKNAHPDDVVRVSDLIESQINSGETRWMAEYRFRCADGTYKTVFDRGFIIFSKEGTPVRMIGCMQDITQRVAYVKTIENHNKQLREIAWMQSHLVRAPLARILGITSLLSEGENSQDKTEEMLSYLSTSAAELDEIIKDIVDKSRNL